MGSYYDENGIFHEVPFVDYDLEGQRLKVRNNDHARKVQLDKARKKRRDKAKNGRKGR